MYRFTFSLLFFLSSAAMVLAQNNVGIGTITPHSSAILDLEATDKGLLLPRLTSDNRKNIGSSSTQSDPEEGLMVYDKTEKSIYFNNKHLAHSWVPISISKTNITYVTTTKNVDGDDYLLLVDGATSAINLTLPDATAAAEGQGRIYTFKAVNLTNPITIAPNIVGQTIDGAANFSFSAVNQVIKLVAYGGKWYIID